MQKKIADSKKDKFVLVFDENGEITSHKLFFNSGVIVCLKGSSTL